MSGPAANQMVPGILTQHVKGMSERPRMGVTHVQDHLEDQETGLQRLEAAVEAMVEEPR